CCPSPEGLVGSNLTAWPWLLVLMRDHWPFQLGYLGSLASSAACAPLIVIISAKASTAAPVELRSNMIVLPHSDHSLIARAATFTLVSSFRCLYSFAARTLYTRRKQGDTRIRIHRLRGTPQSPSYATWSSAAPPRLCRAPCLLDWNICLL